MAISPSHQAYQGVPQLGVPMVTPDGVVNLAWYRFFISLANVCLSFTDPVTGQVSGNPNTLTLMSVQNQLVAADNALQAEITTLQGQVASLGTSVATLNAEVATLNGEVTVLQGQVAALQGQIDTLTFPGTTTGTATLGASGILPAQVRGYLDLTIGATPVKIPIYNP